MNEAQDQAIQTVLNALSFYASAAIYWGEPISLDIPTDRRTLKITREAIDKAPIMKDRGKLARDALFEFEGVFECTYEQHTEPYNSQHN